MLSSHLNPELNDAGQCLPLAPGGGFIQSLSLAGIQHEKPRVLEGGRDQRRDHAVFSGYRIDPIGIHTGSLSVTRLQQR